MTAAPPVPPPLPLPPPVVALAAGIAQYAVSRSHRSTPASRVVAATIAGAAVGVAGTASAMFARAGTTVDPHVPRRASALVTRGPNALTRNPMYLGMAGILVAHAALRRSVLALLPAAAFVAVIDRMQIPAEEAALADAFGAGYEDYRARVPRWLGPRAPAGTGTAPPLA